MRPFACQLVTNLLPSLSPTGAHDCDCSRRRKLTHQHLLVFAEEVCFDFIHFSRSSHLYLSCQSFAVIWYTEIRQFRLWKSVKKSSINSLCQNFGSKIENILSVFSTFPSLLSGFILTVSITPSSLFSGSLTVCVAERHSILFSFFSVSSREGEKEGRLAGEVVFIGSFFL